MIVQDTLPRLLQRNAETKPSLPAMREKRHGIWQTLSWAEYSALVQCFASGLAAHGFARGDRLAVLGDNRARLYAAQLAAQCLGGVAVPTWPNADADRLVATLGPSRVSVAVVEDQEQCDKLLAIKDRLPALRLIVLAQTFGVPAQDPSLVASFDAILHDGKRRRADIFAEIERGTPDEPALLRHGMEAEGAGSGVALLHASLIGAARSIAAAEDVRPTDNCLCYLPMAWIGDMLYSSALGLLIGFTCNCPEDAGSVRRDLRELGPTILLAPPQFWQTMHAEVVDRAAHASPLKQYVFNAFCRRVAASSLRRMVGEVLVYGPVRDQLGLARVRWAHTGGEDVAPDLLRFFRNLGVNLKQTPAATELSSTAVWEPAHA